MRKRQKSIRPQDWSSDERERFPTPLGRKTGRRHRELMADWGELHLRNMISSYSCSLGWLRDRGLLDWSLAPAERWPTERLEAYLEHLERHYAKATATHRIRYLERAIAVLDPHADRSLILSAVARLGKVGPNFERHSIVHDSNDLLQLGLDLMNAAEADAKSDLQITAALYRTGLQIALLSVMSFRIGELAKLTTGDETCHVFEQDGSWRVRFRPGEIRKRKKGWNGPFPKSLVDRLERYLSEYRDVLSDGIYTGTSLWVSLGREQTSGSISTEIRKKTIEAFKKPYSAHSFRRSAVTTMAKRAPQNMAAVARVLGHSIAVSQEHYNLADACSASLELNQTLEQIIKAAKNRRSPRLSRRKGR